MYIARRIDRKRVEFYAKNRLSISITVSLIGAVIFFIQTKIEKAIDIIYNDVYNFGNVKGVFCICTLRENNAILKQQDLRPAKSIRSYYEKDCYFRL